MNIGICIFYNKCLLDDFGWLLLKIKGVIGMICPVQVSKVVTPLPFHELQQRGLFTPVQETFEVIQV